MKFVKIRVFLLEDKLRFVHSKQLLYDVVAGHLIYLMILNNVFGGMLNLAQLNSTRGAVTIH